MLVLIGPVKVTVCPGPLSNVKLLASQRVCAFCIVYYDLYIHCVLTCIVRDDILSCGVSYRKKSDIWALGCILYELVTLRKAFEADVSLTQIIFAHT